jgi:hypothetical protein
MKCPFLKKGGIDQNTVEILLEKTGRVKDANVTLSFPVQESMPSTTGR